MFTYTFWARTFVFAGLYFFYYDNNNGAIFCTNVAIVLAILATIPKEKKE